MRTPVPNSGATYRLNGFYNQHSFALIGAQGPPKWNRQGIQECFAAADDRPLCAQMAPEGRCGIHDDGTPRPVYHRERHADWQTEQRYSSRRSL